MLSGYKTYITAGLSILGTVAAVLEGQMTWHNALPIVISAVLAACVRNGVATSAGN